MNIINFLLPVVLALIATWKTPRWSAEFFFRTVVVLLLANIYIYLAEITGILNMIVGCII